MRSRILASAGDEKAESWQEQRKSLRNSLAIFEAGICRSLLASHLLHPAGVTDMRCLVTPKANTLVQLLLEFEVGPF